MLVLLVLNVDHDCTLSVLLLPRTNMSVVVRLFQNGAVPSALELVRAVVTANPGPLKTKDIYRLAMEQPLHGTEDHVLRPDLLEKTAGPLPPHPKHPIRSLRQVAFNHAPVPSPHAIHGHTNTATSRESFSHI